MSEGRVELFALLLSMLLVSIVVAYAFFTAPEKPVDLVVDENTIPANATSIYHFSPCMGEKSRGVLLQVKAESSSPLFIQIRYPNGTVLLEARGFTRGTLWFVYREGLPCIPLALVVSGKPGSHYSVEVAVATKE